MIIISRKTLAAADAAFALMGTCNAHEPLARRDGGPYGQARQLLESILATFMPLPMAKVEVAILSEALDFGDDDLIPSVSILGSVCVADVAMID